MQADTAPETVDDIRKKRLAYYESLGSGRNEQNEATEASSKQVQDVVLERKALLEGLSQVHKMPNGGPVSHPPSLEVPNKPHEINPKHPAMSKGDVPPQLKTSAFYFEGPPDNMTKERTVDVSIVKPSADTITHKTAVSKLINNNNNVTKPGDGLDPYNETVERLIKATKEELLGMKSKDDIWERLKSGTCLSPADKDSQQPRRMDEKGDANGHSKMSPEILQYGYSDKLRSSDVRDVRVETACTSYNLKEHAKPPPTCEGSNDRLPANGNNNFNAFKYKPFYSSQEPTTFNHHFPVLDQQKSMTSVKVEEIFSSRQMSKSYAPQANFSVADSQEVTDTVEVEQLRASQGVSELGLSTHRPEIDQGTEVAKSVTETDDINLGDTVSKELRLLLGEEKFQQFVMKARKDIEDLHQDRLSERSEKDSKRVKTPRLLKNKPVKESPSSTPQVVDPSNNRKDTHLELKEARRGEVSRSRKILESIVGSDSRKMSGDVEKSEINVKRSEDFTPRVSDGDAVHNMIGKYVLSKETDDKSTPKTHMAGEIKQPNTETKKEIKSILVKKPVPDLNLSELNKPESPRPKLNRPKHEPPTIYQEKKNEDRDTSKSLSDSRNSASSKNYEQIVVPRNVCFSSSEIYSQAAAMEPAFSSHQGGNVPLTPTTPSTHLGAADVSHPSPYGAPVYPMLSTGTPLTPTTPTGPHHMSQSTVFYNQYNNQPSMEDHSNQRRYFSSASRQTSLTSDTGKAVGMQFSQNNAAAAYNQVYQSMPNFSGYYPPHPNIAPPPSSAMQAQYPSNQIPANPPMMMPHPPASSENHFFNQPTPAMAGYQQNPPIPVSQGLQMGYQGYPYPVMMMAPHPPSTPHTPAAPPTPTSIPQFPSQPPPSYQMYQHQVGASAGQASTQPHREMPLVTQEMQALKDEEEEMATTIVDTELLSTAVADTQEKVTGTLVEESTFTSVSQIHVKDEALQPHPPATRKGKSSSPRRHSVVRSNPDAKRHIEGIRQHHEQRRQQQEEKLSDEQLLEKQRKFAKASIERYFTSLENIYGVSHPPSDADQSSPIFEGADEDDVDESPREDEPIEDVVTDVFSTVEKQPEETVEYVHQTRQLEPDENIVMDVYSTVDKPLKQTVEYVQRTRQDKPDENIVMDVFKTVEKHPEQTVEHVQRTRQDKPDKNIVTGVFSTVQKHHEQTVEYVQQERHDEHDENFITDVFSTVQKHHEQTVEYVHQARHDEQDENIVTNVFRTVEKHPEQFVDDIQRTGIEINGRHTGKKAKVTRFSDGYGGHETNGPVSNTQSGNDAETEVNTEITIDAGGVTERLNELGIGVEHHSKHESKSNKENVDEKKKGDKRGKVLIVCPECKGLNKEYMSWCSHCGEMVIGVEPMLVSKNREGKLRMKPLAAEETNQIKNSVTSSSHLIRDKEIEKWANDSPEVNYEQDIPEKPFMLNLEGIKSPEKGESKKHGSPLKSEGRDSGRPSSGELDQEMHSMKLEQEVVDDICDSISDPIVKGYVKSHFAKKKQGSFVSVKEKLKEDVFASLKPEADQLQLHNLKHNEMQTNYLTQQQESVKEEHAHELLALEVSQHGSVKEKVAMFSKRPEEAKSRDVKEDFDMELESVNNTPLASANDRHGEDFSREFSLIPKFSSQAPVQQDELALKLPANSMDFSMDYSQVGSQAFEESVDKCLSLETKTEDEKRAERKQERRRRRGHGAIDVEVFGYDESRESRHSSRTPNAVPTLNLGGSSSDSDSDADDDYNDNRCNSSDEESVVSDAKPEPKSDFKVVPEPKSDFKAVQEPTSLMTGSMAAWLPPSLQDESSSALMTPVEKSRSPVERPRSPVERSRSPERQNVSKVPERSKVSRSPEKMHVSRSPEKVSVSSSPERSKQSRSPGRSKQPKSAGRSKESRSPGRAIQSRSPGSSKQSRSPGRTRVAEERADRHLNPSPSGIISPDTAERSSRQTNHRLEESQEDWKLLFDPNTNKQEEEEELPDDTEAADTANTIDPEQPFLLHLINQAPAAKPRTSKGKPVKSKLRQSLEEPGYQRKWARFSTAWSSYNNGELKARSSLDLRSSTDQGQGRSRPASASKYRGQTSVDDERVEDGHTPRSNAVRRRPASAPRARNHGNRDAGSQDAQVSSPERPGTSQKTRPESANLHALRKRKKKGKHPSHGDDVDLSIDLDLLVEHRLPRPGMLDRLQGNGEPGDDDHMASPQSTYDKYLEMTPRIQAGTVSVWQCLPDEIMLHIFAYLDQTSLTRCAQVCQQFYRVSMDESLWKYITIKKKSDLDDDCLTEISRRHPYSLALIQCQGERVTARGLRDLFRECADSLKELNIARCSRGALSGDSLLLHAAARCHNLTHIDTSWCNITDSGLMAISNTCHRLESLCVNGCQAVSNDGLETVIKKHGAQLRVLELFGCFNISPRGLRCIANNCINLLTLNLGQCYKVTDSCISQLSTSLGRVETLDLRGCKQIKDNCLRRVVKNCPRLKHLSLANCPSITDVSVLEISTYLTDIRNIDLSGCKNITDGSIRALVNTCKNLRHIDISSTGCTSRSVSMIANFANERLETLKINFLSDVTEQSLIKLAKHCHRLRSVHMYGCPSVRHLDKVMCERPSFSIEM